MINREAPAKIKARELKEELLDLVPSPKIMAIKANGRLM
jgi:hypothetical protein